MKNQRRAVRTGHINRMKPFLDEDGSGCATIVEEETLGTVEPIVEEDEDIEHEFDDPNDGDIDDDDDDDDDDGDDGDLAFDEKIVIAGDDTSVLSESRVCFMRHPKRPGKLIMVAVIEDILPEAENEDDNFDCSGTEMFEANLIIHLGKGHAAARKPLDPKSIDPSFFKKKNFGADVYDAPALDD